MKLKDTLLLVGKSAEVRSILRNIFSDTYNIIEAANNEMTVHEALRDIRSDSQDYWDNYKNYLNKYSIEK